MKLFVDDIRVPPDGWVLARTITDAIRFLSTYEVDELSLDHDIAYQNELGEFTGHCSKENYSAVARYVAEMETGERPNTVWVHTANPEGAESIFNILRGKIENLIRDHSYQSEWMGIGK